jgi:hypothetical protein
MPLQNRVDPFGRLFADPARGLFFGNRGGRLHRDDRTLGRRRWITPAWICCRLEFKGRRRRVWGRSYSELFFLDEPTALAAGHRPCFECRRTEARAFVAAFAAGTGCRAPPRAGEIDRVLHAQRLDGTAGRRHRRLIDDLPDGAFLVQADEPDSAFAVRGPVLLRWAPLGYVASLPRPSGIAVDVLTPPAILAALSAGYRPVWHPSAEVIPAVS